MKRKYNYYYITWRNDITGKYLRKEYRYRKPALWFYINVGFRPDTSDVNFVGFDFNGALIEERHCGWEYIRNKPICDCPAYDWDMPF